MIDSRALCFDERRQWRARRLLAQRWASVSLDVSPGDLFCPGGARCAAAQADRPTTSSARIHSHLEFSRLLTMRKGRLLTPRTNGIEHTPQRVRKTGTGSNSRFRKSRGTCTRYWSRMRARKSSSSRQWE